MKVVEGKEDRSSSQDQNSISKRGQPAKVMRYFPLIPRLKRIYRSSKTAEDMRWHDKERDKERAAHGIMSHPADALAWRAFDERYKDFSSDPRSVRLGLASDGFNPYHSSSSSQWKLLMQNNINKE